MSFTYLLQHIVDRTTLPWFMNEEQSCITTRKKAYEKTKISSLLVNETLVPSRQLEYE